MQNYSPLLTDQYQLVMAYSYWKLGMAEKEAVFHLSFRKAPFNSYVIASGLEKLVEFLNNFHFSSDDLDYLRTLNSHHTISFSENFLDYLRNLRFTCDLDAIPEGNLAFAKEPMLRIKGPILQCQLLETPIMNLISFASLVATKASSIYFAAQGDPIVEFGLRRAQGPDGALTASRSAYIGGCVGTSNVLAGKLYDIPISGTQAHSWIMAFPTEQEAFHAFAQVMKDQTILLIDTYDTIKGTLNAISIGEELRQNGYDLVAVRLDSGDLLTLSKKTRQLLDEANFRNTKIIASGDLNEKIIRELKMNNAPIDSWGVGTHLVTSYDQPALNATYKLAAIRDDNNKWSYKIKLSNDTKKATLPGIQQVKRYFQDNVMVGDIIYGPELGEPADLKNDFNQKMNLLIPIFKRGKLIYSLPNIHSIRENCLEMVKNYLQFSPTPYPVDIENKLLDLTRDLTKLYT